MWTLYMHINKINNKKYIGITSQDPKKRWRSGYGYSNNDIFYADIQQYGWDNFEHKIIADHLTIQEIGKLEDEYIEKYQTRNPEFGYNKAKGGVNSGRLGIPHTEETKKKIKAKSHKKSVLCLNTNILYPSISEAARQTRLNFTDISACCNHARGTKSIKGTYWIFAEAPLSSLKECKNKIKGLENEGIDKTKKRILCVETGIIYESQVAAEKTTGISRKNICAVCSGKRLTAGGYHWKKVE